MKKNKKIILIILAILLIVVIGIFILPKSGFSKSNLPEVANAEDLTALIDKIYEGVDLEMPMVMSQALEVTDNDMVKMFTGLENGNDLEFLVASEPMMSSQAYSLVLAKVKDGADATEIAKKMNDNIDTRKWICVSAEKVYSTNSGNIVCLVMSRDELAKPVYESFKKLAGTVGKEYEKTEEATELPDDMLPDTPIDEMPVE